MHKGNAGRTRWPGCQGNVGSVQKVPGEIRAVRECAAKRTALTRAYLTLRQVQEHWPEGRVVPETNPSPKAREAEMFHGPALLIGMAGTAFVAASYAPLSFDPSTPAPQVSMIVGATKGDRLVPTGPQTERVQAAIVEVVGVSEPTVILRARDGAVLYRSDPLSGTTSVSKGADLPVVTVKERPDGPVAYHGPTRETPVSQTPTGAREGSETPAPKERKSRTVGCEAALSSLVKGAGVSLPSRCLV
jgi:hypothetical protein